jgi:CheY-like chemotaxis protein
VDRAATAWGLLDQVRPDAIVLDLMMPGMDGFEALDLLRRLPAWQATPVFIWTSLLLTDDELARLGRSADAILQKGGGSLQALIDSVRQRALAWMGGD